MPYSIFHFNSFSRLAEKKNEFVDQKKKIEVEISEKSDYLVNLKPRLDQIIKVCGVLFAVYLFFELFYIVLFVH